MNFYCFSCLPITMCTFTKNKILLKNTGDNIVTKVQKQTESIENQK